MIENIAIEMINKGIPKKRISSRVLTVVFMVRSFNFGYYLGKCLLNKVKTL
jgi:hypothetical protein